MHGGERHLRRGDRPKIIAFDVVRLIVELGEMTSGDHRVGSNQARWTKFLKGIRVAVEAELHHGAQQPRAPTAVHGEHGASDLGGPLPVEDPELAPDVPVRNPLVVAVGIGIEPLETQHDVVGLARPGGAIRRRHVGGAQQEVSHLGGELCHRGIEGLLLLTQHPALRHQGLGAISITLGP